MEYRSYYNYDVYGDGRIYSHFRNRFLHPEITIHGYKQCTLAIDGKPVRVRVHRLVAFLFLDTPSNYKELVVNHKDGNKLNNHYSNLEWCTYAYNNYHARTTGLNDISKANSSRWRDNNFRKKTSKHISEGLKRSGSQAGENNSRFRYMIFDKYGNKHSRKSLAKMLGISQSYTDALIYKKANGIPTKSRVLEKHGITVIDIKKSQSTIESAV